MRATIFTLLITLPALVLAEPFRNPTTITFQYPTERIDSTTLPIEAIDRVEIFCNNEDYAYTADVRPPETTWEFVTMEPGDYTCRARTYDTDGLVSDWSNGVEIRILRPTAPTIRFD